MTLYYVLTVLFIRVVYDEVIVYKVIGDKP